jgi:hypothetical protein
MIGLDPDPAPESCEGATGLEGRMSSLQNKIRGKRWVYLFDSRARRKRTRRAVQLTCILCFVNDEESGHC